MTKQIRRWFIQNNKYDGWAIHAKGVIGDDRRINGLVGVGFTGEYTDNLLGHEILLFHTKQKALIHAKQMTDDLEGRKHLIFKVIKVSITISIN